MNPQVGAEDGPSLGPIAALLLTEFSDLIPDARLTVEPCPVTGPSLNRALPGEYRVGALDGNAWRDADAARAIARSLASSSLVASAIAVPPHIYVVVSARPMLPTVGSAVLGSGRRYLDARWGDGRHALIAFSNPNYNKPLHLGHLRNNVLGAAIAELIESRGFGVTRSSIVSDWGRHICQAVVGYQQWGGGGTPEDTGEKPDHFVGRHYALFHEALGANPSLEDEAAALLRALDAGTAGDALRLHDLIVRWAGRGLAQTHDRLGSRFDVIFREASTRNEGRALIEHALTTGLCQRRDDNSVFIDLEDRGLGAVTLLRRDGTSVVYTQLLGLNVARSATVPSDLFVAVNGRQWTEGHRILDAVLEAFGFGWARHHEHVLHGMVRSDNETVRSRGGVVRTVDELLDASVVGMTRLLAEHSPAVGEGTVELCAIGLVKYCFLRVRPAKDFDFDEASLWSDVYSEYRLLLNTVREVDAHARRSARSVRDHAGEPLSPLGRTMVRYLDLAPATINTAALRRSPDEVLRFLRRVSTDLHASSGEIPDDSSLWLCLAQVVRQCFALANIELPEDVPWLPPAPPLPGGVHDMARRTAQALGS